MGTNKLNRERKRNFSHKAIAFVTVFALFLSNAAVAELSNVLDGDGWVSSVQAAEIGLDVSYHIQDQIREKIESSGAGLKETVAYDEEPAYSNPYKLGKISVSTKKSSIAMLNNIRYIAGLQDNVTWDDSYGEYAQAAALVNVANNVGCSHYPERPSGMDDTLYQKGKKGAASSNLSVNNSFSLNYSLLRWMADAGTKNIAQIGHRRWILNPSMKKTGFGSAGTHKAMYAFDKSGTGNENRVAWPAQQMPLEFFGRSWPWSLSTDKNVPKANVSVQLTRINDGKVWKFSNKTDNSASNSGYFNVDNSGYGQTSCVIFRPNDIQYSADQKYEVLIKGADSKDIRYTVE